MSPMRNLGGRRLSFTLALVLSLTGIAPLSTAQPSEEAVAQAEGLWEYTDLITKDGQSLPLTGVFLIKNGVFVQQSVFNGQAFEDLGSMAHAGPYWAGGAGLRLRSNQTLSLDPTQEQPITSAGVLEHDLEVTREGDALSLVFGGGTSTVQTFRHLGHAEDAKIYGFADGALAFADGYFILVIGSAEQAITGYGQYELDGSMLNLDLVRWSASDGKTAINLKDSSLTARFDGKRLTLPSGMGFDVIQ